MPSRTLVTVPARTLGKEDVYLNAIMAALPFAYWPLDDAAGARTVREVMRGLVGTPASGVTLAAMEDANGFAPYFDGTASAYIMLPTFALMSANNGTAVSIEAVILGQETGAPGTRRTILGAENVNGGAQLEWGGGSGGAGAVGRIDGINVGTFIAESFDRAAPPVSVWALRNTVPFTHVVWSHTDNGGASDHIYINGVDNIATDNPGGINETVPYSRAIGRRTTATQMFQGSVRHVAIYGRALTAAEALAHAKKWMGR